MTYNLVDEAWIPVTVDGRHEKVGLADVFRRASRITAVGGESPSVRVAVHRLLFAVFMAAVGREGRPWPTWWTTRNVPRDEVLAYLDRQRERFDLLDPEVPFYQTPGLAHLAFEGSRKVKDVALLVPSLASGNNKTLFDHATPDTPRSLPPDAAGRWLLALHSYDLGGTKTGVGSGPGYAKIAPLCGAMHVTPTGRTLAETLLLNYLEVEDWEPGDDAPAWERPPAGVDPADRPPSGMLDWLTWQARRVLLIGDAGSINQVIITPGDHHVPRQRWECEPFVPFRHNDGKGGDTRLPVRLSTTRQAWRDVYSIVARTEMNACATVIRQLVRRFDREGYDTDDMVLTIEVAGTITDSNHQNLLDWRADRFALPLGLAGDPFAIDVLRAGLELGRAVARNLRSAVRFATTPESSGGEGDGWADEIQQAYWARLAGIFPAFVSRLGAGGLADAAAAWGEGVRGASLRAIKPVEIAGAAPGNWERWAKGLTYVDARKPFDAFEDAIRGVIDAATEEVSE